MREVREVESPRKQNLLLILERIHLSFPSEGGRAAGAFHSLFSHTDGKFWMGAVRTGAEGRW
jgi:hypothetical protein